MHAPDDHTDPVLEEWRVRVDVTRKGITYPQETVILLTTGHTLQGVSRHAENAASAIWGRADGCRVTGLQLLTEAG